MRIELYTDARRAEWDAFVAANPEASFRHLSALFAFEEEVSGARNRALVMLDERGRLAGLLPLYEIEERTLRRLTVRTLTSGTTLPAGPLFDAALSAKQQRDALALLMAHVERSARASGAERVTIFYPNVVGERTSLEHFGYLPLRHFGYREHNVVSLLLDLREPRDTLFARLKYSCRKQVNKCDRDGVAFQEITGRDEWLGCYDLNVQTLGALAYTRRAMELVWDDFVAPGHATVTATKLGGRTLSVIVTVGLRASCYNWIAFNSKTDFVNGAHNFALWQTIELWQRRGASFFEIGSMEFAVDKQKNIGSFKESFGGRPVYALGGTLELKPAKRALLDLVSVAVAAARARGRAAGEKTAAASAPAEKVAPGKGTTDKAAPGKVAPGGAAEVAADVPAGSGPR